MTRDVITACDVHSHMYRVIQKISQANYHAINYIKRARKTTKQSKAACVIQ